MQASRCGSLDKWKTVLGGFLIHAVLGTLHCFGNMALYTISYMRVQGDSQLKIKDATWIYATCVVGQGLFGFLGGKLESAVGPRLASLLGSTLLSTGYALSYYTSGNFYYFLLSYGILGGVGAGLVYPVPLACALRNLPNRKALVSGIILLGRAVGILLYAPVQTWFVNPLNVSPDYTIEYDKPPSERYYTDASLTQRVPLLFLYSAYAFAAMLITGSLLLDDGLVEEKSCLTIEGGARAVRHSQSGIMNALRPRSVLWAWGKF